MRYFRILIISLVIISILFSSLDYSVYAFGYDFVYPSARRSAVSGWEYADPGQPSHLAWDYRFPMHTTVAAA